MANRWAGILLSLLISTASFAQEAHYWTNQVGATATMLGGAVTAGIRDNSAIFYNPGALGYIENTSLSAVGDAYFVNWLTIKNGAGQGLDLTNRRVSRTGQLFSGIVKNKKNPDFSVNYAVLNRHNFDYRMFANNEAQYDVIESRPGLENYLGSYDYLNITREDWLGVGLGHVLGESRDWGIGASVFLVVRSQDWSRVFRANVTEDTAGVNNLLAFVDMTNNFEYRAYGLVSKIGFSFDNETWVFGFTIKPPLLNVNLLGRGSMFNNVTTYIPSQSAVAPQFNVIREKLQTTYKTPWTLDLGAGFKWGESNIVGLRAAYYAKVAPYSLFEESSTTSTDTLVFDNIRTASKRVLNLGIGVSHDITSDFAALVGFRTDFNHYDNNAVNRDENLVNSIAYWDLYSLSGGVLWHREKFDLNLGAQYQVGRSDGDLQQINLTDPKDFRLLQGERDFTASTSTGQFLIVLGFTYKFPRI